MLQPARRQSMNARATTRCALVIDNPHEVEHLLDKTKASLPLTAAVRPALAALIQERSRAIQPARECRVVSVDYAGDEGGTVCKLQLGPVNTREVLIVSLTHLRFDRRGPLAREITKYQEHRVKRLRRLNGPRGWL
jgi:hypothetical protein